ncbi:MAG: hypothetical protein RL660_1945 [Bacteroidota bacterium]|jgi:uncharacterized protein (TIGR01777 family)
MYNAYVLAGGSGFVGSVLAKKLAAHGNKVYILTRQANRVSDGLIHYVQWNTEAKLLLGEIKESNVCLINLAGANVAHGRWTSKRKEDLLTSRTSSIETLLKLVRDQQIDASYFFSASAIGYYGVQNKPCAEDMPPSNDFLGNTCKAWEEAAMQFAKLQIPYSIGRIGLVMGNDGGAYPELKASFTARVSAVPSSGEQIYSWIHIQDAVDAILHLCRHKLEGVYNITAPLPCNAKTLMQAIGKATGKSFFTFIVPKFMLQLLLGEFSVELTKSANISSKKLEQSGYTFHFSNIDDCMHKLAANNANN